MPTDSAYNKMFNVKTYNKISNAIYDSLNKDRYVVNDTLDNPDAILVRSAKLHDVEFPSSLKAIARAGAGTNNIPIDRCSENGIVVFNTPGANANAVKEMVIATILLSTRHYEDSINWVKTLKGNGAAVPELVEKGKGKFVGNEIVGKKLGVVGLGAIGALVANAAKGLGMTVYGCDPYLSIKSAWSIDSTVINSTEKEIQSNCDYISLHVPLTDETKGKINKEYLSKLKDGVVIINFSRAELVVAEDMIEALESGKVSFYGVDFPTEEMIGVKNCVCTPHLASGTEESEENCAHMAAMELKEYLENGNIVNSVNFPTCIMPDSDLTKITVIHANVPNVISKITGIIASEKINIEDMKSCSKGMNAYMIIQIQGAISQSVLDKIKNIDEVVSVRLIEK